MLGKKNSVILLIAKYKFETHFSLNVDRFLIMFTKNDETVPTTMLMLIVHFSHVSMRV